MAKIPMGKMPSMKGGKAPKPSTPGKVEKPHIKMRKMKPVPPSAFPQTPMAFPPDQNPPSPDQTISQGGGMGAASGDMGA